MQITEAIFQNRPCFLSQPEWQSTLHSIILKDPTSPSRNEQAISLWMCAAHIPLIFRDTTNKIFHTYDVNDELQSRIKSLSEKYQRWYLQWGLDLESAVEELLAGQISEVTILKIEIYCDYLAHFCLVNRLLSALDPDKGEEVEEAVVEASRRLLATFGQYVLLGQPQYRMGLSVFVARATLCTTNQWKAGISGSVSTVDARTFRSWCAALRRKGCPDQA